MASEPGRSSVWLGAAIWLAIITAASWLLSAWTQTLPANIFRFSGQWALYTVTSSIIDTLLLFGGSFALSFLITRLGDQRGMKSIVALALVITGLLTLMFGVSLWSSNRHLVRDGEPCGPHHHWVTINVTPDVIPDLSCEDDAR